MNRRDFLHVAPIAAGSLVASPAYAQAPFANEKSKLKITGVRLVKPGRASLCPPSRLRRAPGQPPGRSRQPDVDLPGIQSHALALSTRSRQSSTFTVEIATDKGIKGYGNGGPGGGHVVEQHLAKLLMDEDPFDIERIWDIMWRSTMSYGRMGVTMNAISGVDLALWDIIGKALNMPVYKLLGGETKTAIPTYCTGNDIEQHVEFGYKRLKLAIPHGPADGRDGMRKNVELVSARARRSAPTATSCSTAGWRGPSVTRSRWPR